MPAAPDSTAVGKPVRFRLALVLAAIAMAMPAPANAQVFFGSRPATDVVVTPLFIVADVSAAEVRRLIDTGWIKEKS